MSQVNSISVNNCASANPASLRPSYNIMSLIALWRSRQQLAQLDAHQLADIGVHGQDAAAEAARAPWDVPAHWRN